MMPTIEPISLTLLPFESRSVQMAGRKLRCTEASGRFNVSFDGRGSLPFRSGMEVVQPDRWQTLMIYNPTAATMTVLLFVYEDSVSFQDNEQKAKPTYPKGRGLVTLEASGDAQGRDKVALTGADAGNARFQLIVTNMGNQTLYLTDGAGNIFMPVASTGFPVTVFGNGSYILANPNNAQVQAIIGEVFYANT